MGYMKVLVILKGLNKIFFSVAASFWYNSLGNGLVTDLPGNVESIPMAPQFGYGSLLGFFLSTV